MTDYTYITEEMLQLVEKEWEEITLEVTSTGCRMFARAVGHTDRIFYDRDVARARGYRNIVAPPGYLGTQVFDPVADSRPLIRRLGLPLERGLNAGTQLEYFDTITADDVLVATPKIIDLTERDGKSGRMVFMTVQTMFRRDGRVVAKTENTTILH